MPFKSEKQRRYLWANEPEIAREWTDRYGASQGGITRLPFENGSQWYNPMSWDYGGLFGQAKQGLEQHNAATQSALDQVIAESGGILEPDLNKVNKMSMIPDNFIENLQSLWGGEPEAPTGIMKAGGYPFMDPTDGNYIARDGIMEVVNEDRIPGRIQEAALPKPNMFNQGLDFLMDKGTGLRQGLSLVNENYLMPALAGIGTIANRYNPLKEGSQNYNPDLQGQVDILDEWGMLGDQSSPYKITSGPLAGKNLVSGFGTNDYRKMLQKRIDYFRNKKSLTESQNQKMHEAIAEEKRILEKKTREAAAAAASQRRAGRGGDHMSRSRDQGGLGISRSQAQAVSDANRDAGMSGWGL